MMRILLDKLEERMKGTPADGTIQKLFVGKIKSYIRCINISYESSREEDFYDLQVRHLCFSCSSFSPELIVSCQLDVKGCKDIYDSFSRYVAKETLNGDNQYDAGDE
jgi:ubiquitin carboxyl-terminal hydrolase 7